MRKLHGEGKGALAMLDVLIAENVGSALDRPHQLLLTGDQIYAYELARPLLNMLNATAQPLIGTSMEQVPFNDNSKPPKIVTARTNLINFPVGRRGTQVEE